MERQKDKDRSFPGPVPSSGEREIDRRRFFTRMTAFIAGGIALTMSIPLVGYILSPALRRAAREWIEVGSVADLTPLEPTELTYVTARQDGWMASTVTRSIWAVKQPDGTIVVYSPICPHLGCAYLWYDEEREFRCPCHLSVFDIHGKVLGGPAPRPLDRLPAEVKDGRLSIVYKVFKAGVPDQVEI